MVGRPSRRRVLREGEGGDALGRHPLHLLGRQRRVPHGDQHERDVAPGRRPAPLFDDPVVVVLQTLEPELAITRIHEQLAAEPSDGREAQRGQDPRPVHVLEAGHGVVTPGAHLRVRQGLGTELFLRLPGHSAQAGTRVALAVVDPVVHPVDGLHVRRPVAVLGGHPVHPEIRWFEDVVVDRDQPVQVQVSRRHAQTPSSQLRPAVRRCTDA